MRIKNSIVFNALSNYVGQFYLMLITLGSIPIYIQYLDSEAYGLLGFFILLQSFAGLLDFGLNTTVGYEIASAKADTKRISFFLMVIKLIEVFFIVISILLLLLIYFNSELIVLNWIKSVKLKHSDIIYCLNLMGLIIVFKLYSTLYKSGINGIEDQLWNNKALIYINSLKYIGASIIIMYLTNNIVIYFLYQAIIACLETVILYKRFYKNISIVTPENFKKYNLFKSYLIYYYYYFFNKANQKKIILLNIESKKSLLKTLKFSLSIGYASMLTIILMQFDKLLLSKNLSLQLFGYLNVVNSINGLILIMATPIFLAYLPKMTALCTSKNYDDLLILYTQMTKITTLVTMVLTAVIVFNGAGILYVITGSIITRDWGEKIIAYYAIGTGFYVLGSVQYYLLNALGQLKPYVIACTLSVLLLVPAFYIVIKEYGVQGASLLWMTYGLGWFFLWGTWVHKKVFTNYPNYHYNWLFKNILPLIASITVLSSLLYYFINFNYSESKIAIVVSGTLIGTIVFAINSFWIKEFRNKIKYLFYPIKIS